MIESPPDRPSPRQSVEWVVRALNAEGLSYLLCGKGALDLQAEYTGSVDTDILAGRDAQSVLYTLDEYANRGDLVLAWADPGATVRYLVRGWSAVDVIPADPVDPDLYGLLQRSGSTVLSLGPAGEVRAITREGYFVLAIVLGEKGFARRKSDPMAKVREGWDMFGVRTDRQKVERLLAELGMERALDRALAPPRSRRDRRNAGR